MGKYNQLIGSVDTSDCRDCVAGRWSSAAGAARCPACPACEKPQVGSTRWKYGERCVSCAAAEHYAYISSYNLTVAPWWEFTDDCENCDRR